MFSLTQFFDVNINNLITHIHTHTHIFSYSDEVFSQQSRKLSNSSTCSDVEQLPMGPAGDCSLSSIENKIDPVICDLSSLTIKDLVKIKRDLGDVAREMDRFNLEDISKDDLYKLKLRLSALDLRCLARFELSSIKSDMQNKYHAELEILREDYENRIDVLNVEHENKLQKLRESYQEEISALKYELDEALHNVQLTVSSTVQEVVSKCFFVCLTDIL